MKKNKIQSFIQKNFFKKNILNNLLSKFFSLFNMSKSSWKIGFNQFNKKISQKDKITKIRLDNFSEFIKIGFPSKKQEDWKFSNFNKIIRKFNKISVNLNEKSELKFNNFLKEIGSIAIFNPFNYYIF